MTNDPQPPSPLSRSAELLWRTDQPTARGPRPALTLDQIVDTAIEVADSDGIDGLSMRRIARELGVGTMSLYRYVPGKSELLDLMLDRVSGPGDLATRTAKSTWRETLEMIAKQGRALYHQHPWLLSIDWARPVFGPNTLASTELTVASLKDLPITDQARIVILSTVDAYVTGSARQEIMYTGAAEETGISDDEYWAVQFPVLEQAMATGLYPTMAQLSEDAFNASWDETFEFGLRCLLDGLERLIESGSEH